MILAGDVGGTKCTFTLFPQSDSGLNPAFRLSLPTKSAATFEAVLGQFRNEAASQGHDLNQLKAAAFGIAGAVVGDRVLSSNLPWPVERKFIATALNLATEKVLLLNDLVAAAASLAHLDSNDLLKLNDGIREPRAPMALIEIGRASCRERVSGGVRWEDSN